MDFDFSGYGDIRLVNSPQMTSWLKGGLGKFRYGDSDGALRFGEAVGQGELHSRRSFGHRRGARRAGAAAGGLDALEAYLAWHPAHDGAVRLVGEGRRLLSHHQPGE